MADETETTNPPETTTVAEETKSGGTIGEIAGILANYVPKGEHDRILDALNSLDGENAKLKAQLAKFDGVDPEKLRGRISELEGKVRTRNHSDAFNAIADELEIDPDFRDDVFDMAKWPMDKDEADPKAMKAHFRDWLDAKDARKKYLKSKSEETPAAEGQGQGNPAPEAGGKVPRQPRLHTEESGRGGPSAGGKMFRYRSSDLSNHEWMRTNAQAYAKAAAEGRLQKIG